MESTPEHSKFKPPQPEKLIAGGGWKSNSPGPRIKVKAVLFSPAAAASMFAGFEYYDKYGNVALAPGTVLFVTSVLLLIFERYTDLAEPQDGNRDHRNLY